MICPKDLVQMNQWRTVGGGESTDNEYTTYEVKICPTCGRKVLEFYTARVITEEEAKAIAGEDLEFKWSITDKNKK